MKNIIRINLVILCVRKIDKSYDFRHKIQAALVIRGFSIRGFDYSRTQKPRITRENCHFLSN